MHGTGVFHGWQVPLMQASLFAHSIAVLHVLFVLKHAYEEKWRSVAWTWPSASTFESVSGRGADPRITWAMINPSVLPSEGWMLIGTGRAKTWPLGANS